MSADATQVREEEGCAAVPPIELVEGFVAACAGEPDGTLLARREVTGEMTWQNVPLRLDTLRSLVADYRALLSRAQPEGEVRRSYNGPAPAIEMCDNGHRFGFLPDHPMVRDGHKLCPHCATRPAVPVVSEAEHERSVAEAAFRAGVEAVERRIRWLHVLPLGTEFGGGAGGEYYRYHDTEAAARAAQSQHGGFITAALAQPAGTPAVV